MKSGALVIVNDRCIGTGIVRSLGRQGIPVWTLHERADTLLFSRYVDRSLYWPSNDEEDRVQYLEDLAVRCSLQEWVLFGTADGDVKFVGHHHERLSKHYRLASSKWTDVAWAYDKKRTYQLAADLKLDHPWTIYPSSRSEVEALVCTYPVILKPSVKESDNRFTHDRAWRTGSHNELLTRYDEACRVTAPESIMIQEWIPGGGEGRVSVGAVCDRGKPLGRIVVRQLRQYPIYFGRSSTFVQTVDCPEVESAAYRLISSTNYSGCIEAEYKLDAQTGRYKLLDVNPRLWGWHSIGAMAGVDFPYLQWKQLVGERISLCEGRIGVRWIRMSRDLHAVFDRIWAGDFSLREYLNSIRGPMVFAIFAIDDPVPACCQMLNVAYRRLKQSIAP